jgi:hypothetical protein
MSTEPNKVIYSMVGVSKYYDKKAVLKDIYLSYFYGAKIGVIRRRRGAAAPDQVSTVDEIVQKSCQRSVISSRKRLGIQENQKTSGYPPVGSAQDMLSRV